MTNTWMSEKMQYASTEHMILERESLTVQIQGKKNSSKEKVTLYVLNVN